MCTKNLCGLMWSTILASMLVASLIVPWYAEAVLFRGREGDEAKETYCSQITQFSWNKAYCTIGSIESKNSSYCSNLPEMAKKAICSDGEIYDWRDSKSCHGKCSHRGKTFDLSVACTAVASVASVVSVLGFLIRFCCEKREASSALLLGVGVVGILSLIFGVAYFAAALPDAYAGDKVTTCTAVLGSFSPFTVDIENSPCSKFIGDITFDNILLKVAGIMGEKVWGPIGWIIATAALPVYIIVLCLSYNPGKRQGLQGDGPVVAYTRYT